MPHDETAISIEAFKPHDIAAALNLQTEAYPPFLIEDEAAFFSRITLAASYCFAAKQGEEMLGYLLAHGWKQQSPPPLGIELVLGAQSEVLFIHDLAVSSSCRGLGIGRRLIMHAFEQAAQDGLRSAELIAVEDAADYWRRLDFTEGADSIQLSEKLSTYGTHAQWMIRDIPQNG